MRAPLHTNERGVVAVLTAIVIVALLAMMALALNIGHLFAVRGELQNAADAAALAGARTLDGTTDTLTGARDDAEGWGERHLTDSARQVQVLQDSATADIDGDGAADRDVDVGFWNPATRHFTAYSVGSVTTALASCATLPCINAVRVVTHRDPTHGGTFDVDFAGILGKTTQDLRTVAVAVTGPPCGVDCADLPIALPDCGVLATRTTCAEGNYIVRFKNDTTDTGAWTTFQDEEGGGADLIKCFLDEAIANGGRCRAESNCTFRGNPVVNDIGLDPVDPIWVENGQVNTACTRIEQLYASNPDREYTVPVADVTCGEDQKWVQTPSAIDIAIIKITVPPVCTGQDNIKEFTVRRICGSRTPHGIPGGCAGSVWSDRPRLVR